MAVSTDPSQLAAFPLTSKRKFSSIVDLTADEDESGKSQPPPTNDALDRIAATATIEAVNSNTNANGNNFNHNHNDHDHDHDHDDSDDASSDGQYSESLMQDMVEQFELEPYEHDGTMGLSLDRLASLHLKLRQVGIDRFVADFLDVQGLDVRQLGIVFGLNPRLNISENAYGRLLGHLIERSHHKRSKLNEYNTIDDAAQLLRTSNNIMVITGAGVSTSLGIPDFRSKDSGFYEKLRAQGYDEPEQVFDIGCFDENPSNFYHLAGDLLPAAKRFSPTHAFIRLLQDKNRLQTNYTQNIDNLEEVAGIQPQRLIQAHGSFATASCRRCRFRVKGTEIYPAIRAKQVPSCPRCLRTLPSSPRPPKRVRSTKGKRRSPLSDDEDDDDDIPEAGVMKPDITFFGEPLPDTFFERFSHRDAHEADLVIVIGTSMKVSPVSEMPNHLPHAIPHIYISREPIKHVNFDIQLLGKCDDIVVELCRRAGWELQHEMIPPHFTATVSPVPNSPHCWFVHGPDHPHHHPPPLPPPPPPPPPPTPLTPLTSLTPLTPLPSCPQHTLPIHPVTIPKDISRIAD